MWVKMLETAGMDDASMMKWHAEFEDRAPNAHDDFLLSLGIQKEEAQQIQKRSQQIGSKLSTAARFS